MNKIIIALILLLLIECKTESTQNTSYIEMTGKYFGQDEPKLLPEIFAPNIVSTGMSEINACFSPDYNEFLYSIILPDGQFVIMTMSYSGEKWSNPEVAKFSGKYSDADPFITLDGKWLYFVSKRPTDTNQKMKKDWDIWRLEKVNGEWSNLERLGSDINSEADDIYPTLTKKGTLYYSSGRYGNNNRDIFYAVSNGNNFNSSLKLNDTINSNWEGDVYISPEEDYMIFASYDREEGSGLFISFNNSGIWAAPVRMSEEINRTGREFCPMVSPDGRFFFFTSNRTIGKEESKEALSYKKIREDFIESYSYPGKGKNDIYWVDSGIIEKYRNKSR